MNYCIAKCEAGAFDEALPHLQNLSQSQSSELSSIASSLLSVIATDAPKNFSNFKDNLKYQYLYFNRLTVRGEDAEKLVEEIKDPYQKLQAISIWINLLNKEKNFSRVDSLYSNLNYDVTAQNSAIGEINYQYLLALVGSKSWKSLDVKSKKLFLNKDREKSRTFFKAFTQAGLGQVKQAQSTYLLALKADPLNEQLVLEASSFFNANDQLEKAYNILLKGIQINPYSVVLHKAYALQCLQLNLETYGDDTMNRLSLLLNPSEFNIFEKEYVAEKERLQ
jgi:predicted Zn-dependent protease